MTMHNCDSYRNGDWIIFYCNKCKDYERRINWKTGKMIVKNDNFDILHIGLYVPTEYISIYNNNKLYKNFKLKGVKPKTNFNIN